MMLLSLLKFEWQLHCRQPVFLLGLLACGVFGGFLILNQSVDSAIEVAGPYNITSIICTLAMMIMPFVVSAFTGHAIVRDRNADISELVFTTPIKKWHYLMSRWMGLVVMSCLVFMAGLLGILLGLIFSETASLYTMWIILWPALVLIVPGIVLLSAMLFAVGLFSNQNIAVYVSASVLFLLYQILAIYAGSPLMATPALPNELLQQFFAGIDPYGATAFFEQVKYWNPAQRNNQFFELDATLLTNRMVVLSLAVVIMVLCYRKFEFKLKDLSRKAVDVEPTTLVECHYKPVLSESGFKVNWLAFVSQCKIEYLCTLKTRVFAAVLVFWLFVLAAEIITGFTYLESLGTTPVANTAEALWRFQQDILPRFVTLFLVFFSAEMAWRDKQLGVAAFIETSPVEAISLFFAKWVALLLIPVTFITLAIGTSAALQWLYGGDVQWLVYLSLYYYCGLPMVCIAALCLFIHSISANKFIGMTVSFGLVILAITPVGGHLGLEHGMFKFSTSPLMQYSDLNGFGASADAFNGYIKYWLSLSATAVVLAYKKWSRQVKVMLAVAVLSTAFFASEVYYQTNDVAHYQSSEDNINWRSGYEQNYGQYQNLPSPKVTAVKTRMAFYPEQHRYQMMADFTLINPHAESLTEILLSTDTTVDFQDLKISGATLADYDALYGQYLFKLNRPMRQGDRLQMSFNAGQVQNGYLGLQATNLITPGFSYIQALRYMPFMGFNPHYLLKSPALRREQGLPELAAELPLEQAIVEVQGDFSDDYDWVEFETELSTTIGEVAVAPGKLLKHWQDGGRNYYHYKTAGPIRNVFGYLSGRYEIATKTVDGIQLEVYYLAAHKANVPHTLDAMSGAMSYANQHFGRYPAAQLRLMEVPRSLRLSGYAMPQSILISEHQGFATDLTNKAAFDQIYRRTAHEVSHQWWGHGLNSALTEGDMVLVETLAKYSEMVMLEQRYGEEYVRRLIKFEHNRYFNGRGYSREHELPLYRADAKHLIYSKGAVAMYALKQILGEQAINQALRQLMKNHYYPQPPATTLDFIAALKQATTADNHPAIERWLKQIVIDDLSITSASYQQLDDNRYQINVCLQSQQIAEDGFGNSTAITTDTTAWLGVFNEHPDNLTTKEAESAVLKLEEVSVRSQGNCLSWTVDQQPTHIAIDPFYQVLDQRRDNNVLILTGETL